MQLRVNYDNISRIEKLREFHRKLCPELYVKVSDAAFVNSLLADKLMSELRRFEALKNHHESQG